jgi:hypothetical protein
MHPDELLSEIKALRVDVQELPEKIAVALAKKVGRTLNWIILAIIFLGCVKIVSDWLRK